MDMSTESYHIVEAPKLASQYAHDCRVCGHEELTRPMFVSNGNGAIAVGTGCGAKLLGLAVAEVEVTHARNTIAAIIAERPSAAQVWSDFTVCLPGRVTPKFLGWVAERSPFVSAEELATIAEAYKVLARHKAVRG